MALRRIGDDVWMGTEGHGPFVSADGGVSAQPASAAAMLAPYLTDVARDAGGTVYLATGGSGVFRSADGGLTWTAAWTGSAHPLVDDVAAGDAGQVWAAAWRGLHASTDGGDSWEVAGFDDARVRGVRILASGNLLAVADGESQLPAIHRSTDAGASWSEVWSSPTAFQLPAFAVTDDGTLLAAGMSLLGSVLVRSTDGGATWQESTVGTGSVTALAAGVGGAAWAAGGDNVVRRSTDHGVTWDPLPAGGWPTGTVGSLRDLALGPDGLLIVATGGVFRSTDLGDTWSAFDEGLPAGGVTFVEPTGAGLFAGTGDSGLFRLSGPTGVDVGPPGVALPSLRLAPNPFRQTVRVSWDLPRPASVRVRVHDARGRRVTELAAGRRPAGRGSLSWNGTAGDGSPVPPGVYFVRWEADGRSAGAKVVRVR